MRITDSHFSIKILKQKALEWANQESDVLCFLDSNDYAQDKYGKYEALLAVGARAEIKVDTAKDAFEQLRTFAAKYPKDWLFGHLAYDLKNEVEHLFSNHFDDLEFPDLYFFVPRYLFIFHKDGSLEIISQNKTAALIWQEVQAIELSSPTTEVVEFQQKISKKNYLETIQKIRQHIIDGDIYELNFCQEFFANKVKLNPLTLFDKMNTIAKAPFAAYYKRKEQHLLCGSPERFMCKQATKITSQPIKGTIKRGQTAVEDEALKEELYHSAKDRAENIMIVDLVRNDLAKTCQTGSIKVEELFKIYPFERVFQMISTVTGELKASKDWVDALREAFPMGSMTGAPKVISMQLIEAYEQSKRGLYAGTVGYISPERDFDFNVVIRSLFYNAAKEYLSFQVGGAIVYDSEPIAEYEECLLKSKTMLEALN